jgi:hypothetical protein
LLWLSGAVNRIELGHDAALDFLGYLIEMHGRLLFVIHGVDCRGSHALLCIVVVSGLQPAKTRSNILVAHFAERARNRFPNFTFYVTQGSSPISLL